MWSLYAMQQAHYNTHTDLSTTFVTIIILLLLYSDNI